MTLQYWIDGTAKIKCQIPELTKTSPTSNWEHANKTGLTKDDIKNLVINVSTTKDDDFAAIKDLKG